MNNPCKAFKGTFCDNCKNSIQEEYSVYLHDGNRYCQSCADDINIKCDCGNYKKDEYDQCYECFENK